MRCYTEADAQIAALAQLGGGAAGGVDVVFTVRACHVLPVLATSSTPDARFEPSFLELNCIL